MDLPHFEHVEAAIDRAAQALPAVEAAPDRSHWAALESLIGPALLGQFMFMGEATTPGDLPLYRYKHGATRSYLNVAADLSTWTYRAGPTLADAGTYERTNLAAALAHAFDGAEQCGAGPNVPYDGDFRAKRDAALAAAGYRVIAAQPGRGVA